MKRILTISAIFALVLMGCNVEPVANFAYSPNDPLPGEDVYFDNLSIDAYSYEWNFDDGTVSNVVNPIHQFPTGGSYVVELKAFGKRSGMDVYTLTVDVQTLNPTADFWVSTSLPTDEGDVSVETDIVFLGEQVEFNNASLDALSYQWDFGDGYTSDLESPVYSYDVAGTYTVSLVAQGGGTDIDVLTKDIEVVEGINSALRITVLDVDEDYYPLEDASVILYESYDDWYDYLNALPETFTSALGKCVYEGLNAQRYYVDAWYNDNYNNSDLGVADPGWVETQILEPGYIHDFFAYIEYTGSKKSVTMERVSRKAIPRASSEKKATEVTRALRTTKFSKELKK